MSRTVTRNGRELNPFQFIILLILLPLLGITIHLIWVANSSISKGIFEAAALENCHFSATSEPSCLFSQPTPGSQIEAIGSYQLAVQLGLMQKAGQSGLATPVTAAATGPCLSGAEISFCIDPIERQEHAILKAIEAAPARQISLNESGQNR